MIAIEELRARALAHLGARDARAQRILAAARIAIVEDDLAWEASHGDVRGVRVVLGTDPASLGALAAFPAIHDALSEALAAAIASPGLAMTALDTAWEPSIEDATYRGSALEAASSEALARAIEAYLAGAEDRSESRVREARRALARPIRSR